MATYDFILVAPAQTDTTNFDWSEGIPMVITEEVVVGGVISPEYYYFHLLAGE